MLQPRPGGVGAQVPAAEHATSLFDIIAGLIGAALGSCVLLGDS